MAFVQCKILSAVPKINFLARAYSAANIKKSVFISQSNDVYTNMALEEWIHKNFDFSNQHIMLCYKNDPCIVVSNEGNPWTSTNVSHHNDKLQLARREGKGRTLYQDNGMLNFTFFGKQRSYDQDYNLGVITRGMFRKYGMKLKQDKDDLTFYNMKVSGNGVRSEGENYYHNCSLFVNVNKDDFLSALLKENSGLGASNENIITKKNYLNITEIDSRVTSEDLLSTIGWEYMRTPAYTLKDGGQNFAKTQKGFQMINPTENWFPGLNEIRNKLIEWDWCFGKTPEFTITRSFCIPEQFLNKSIDSSNELHVKLVVTNGKISSVSLVIPAGLTSNEFTGEAKAITGLKGHKFTEDALNSIESVLGVDYCHNPKEMFVTNCVRQAMTI